MGKVVDVAGIVRSGLLLLLLAFGVFGVEGRKMTHPSEVAALRAVRRSFIDPMKYLRSWDSEDPCRSSWRGVTCNKSSDDGYLHIRELQLLNMNLSGSLATELGELSHLELLDFMWNNISGSIPKEIGNITSLKLLLLNGNQLSGSLPDELGHLSKLDRLQIDENSISGPLPKTFVNLVAVKHLHMNNNSISGQIPPEIAKLPKLLHFLLDNNNLSGYLPPEFAESKTLLILQLDNNNFSGASIPESYGRMPILVKLSLRNCSLKGTIPDLSSIPELTYLDLSWNNLEGPLPSKRLSNNITTIDVSNNKLNGSIPSNISYFPALQFLCIKNNSFSGSLSISIWDNITFSANGSFVLDARNNFLSNISGVFSPPSNVTIMLQGNKICSNQDQLNVLNACGFTAYGKGSGSSSNFAGGCPPQACPKEGFFEYIPASPQSCYCAAPLGVGYRLKSPGFSDFRPYLLSFENELAHNLSLVHYQIFIDTFIWEKGPRLRMHLKLFPNLSREFNVSEVRRLRDILAGWKIHNTDIFGPYELLNFTLQGPYSNLNLDSPAHWSKATLLGIIIGTISGAFILAVVVSILVLRRNSRYQHLSCKSSFSNSGTRPENLKGFSLEELAHSTNYFSDSSQVGSGGYGNVYKGTLADGTVVAIKRASEGSLQGSREFYTEIELLSRIHHKNLVSLVGYCAEKSEQMLIYEFMPNGTLRDHLSTKSEKCLDFPMRLRIALGSARGILYLHNEADPPIFHRDIKASNILLDSNFTAKVADFGLSRLAPEPDAEGIVHGHVSTVVRGTPGYLDPEYFLTHKLTDKSDVYSLGVVFLELLTGKRPISNGKNIVREVRTAYNRSRIFSVVDDRLCSYPPTSVESFASLALRCCNEDLDSRPAMPEVVRELESIRCMTMEAEFTHSESEVTDTSLPHSEQLCKSSSTSESYSRSGNNSTIFPR